MIIVLGSVSVQPDKVDEALRIAQEHVARSRQEPGCIEHGVHRSVEDMNRLVFVERWSDMAALQAHFAVRESKLTVRQLAALATAAPAMSIYNAEALPAG